MTRKADIGKRSTIKERIIKRLNKGFAFNLPLDVRWRTHQKAFKDEGGLSWFIFAKIDTNVNPCEEVGSCDSATKCLSYDRWVLNQDTKEISQYFDSEKEFYERYYFLIEKI